MPTIYACAMNEEIIHYPVMYKEVLELLAIKEQNVVVDCTAGLGSHASKFLEVMKRDSLYIGIDKDQDSLNIAEARLRGCGRGYKLVKNDFSKIDKVLNEFGIDQADVFFFDLGISTYQLATKERGFSFSNDGPLDMRMDRNYFVNAYDLVNNLSEDELKNIFWKFGEERYSSRIARAIIQERAKEPISTTAQLAEIVAKSLYARSFKYRIHPATRVFQALRIAVNRELEVLRIGIDKAIMLLKNGGRIGIISFHSLEDRIVKHTFRHYANEGVLKIITKKPVEAREDELRENISSRSAKLRVAHKIG